MSTVTITLQNDDNLSTKIPNVAVYVYNTSAVFVTSGVTDSNGVLTISLPDGSYDLLFFMYSLSVLQPQRIVVNSSLINHFLIVGHLRTRPESLNPDLCRVSGYIYGPDGKPRKEVAVRFNQKKKNEIVSNIEVLNIPITFHSDENGYFQFDLFRGMELESYVDGYEYRLCSKVPDYASVDVFKLLFPLPIIITHPNAISLPMSGGPLAYTYTVGYNDGNNGKMSNEWSHVKKTLSNDSTVSLTFTDTHIIVTPIATGTVTVTFTREIDECYVWRNPDSFTASPLVITVS